MGKRPEEMTDEELDAFIYDKKRPEDMTDEELDAFLAESTPKMDPTTGMADLTSPKFQEGTIDAAKNLPFYMENRITGIGLS